MSSLDSMPTHVAIAMDGNGRWATKRGLSRLEGHRQGAKAALDIVRYCGEKKIKYLTLYAFSSENWGRPEEEVLGLMEMLYDFLTRDHKELIQNGVVLKTIGAVERLPGYVQKALRKVCDETKDGKNLCLNIALSYGSRDEIVRAAKKIAAKVQRGQLALDQINEDLFSTELDTTDLPDPDLWIRTSGVMRLSNFLLWQVSYAELYFTDVFWPDFTRKDFDLALAAFQNRQRRFGLTGEQIEKNQVFA